jgi:protein-S-isoprenylcysteine O-methyltransferase Ste14
MFFRALFAFLSLPVIVAGLVPWYLSGIDGCRMRGTPLGWPLFLLGGGIVLWCARDFYVIGKGTLAPWDPPRKLVIIGLYKFTRNPMYVGVLGCVAGWSLIAGSPLLIVYMAILALGFHLRVVFYEEPLLARQFGPVWTQYSATVNRWLPKLRKIGF